MNNFLERLKTDKTLQLILVLMTISLLIFSYIFIKPFFVRDKRPEIPCYKANLKIWMPFESWKVEPYFSEFKRFCVNFQIEQKSFEDIDKELPIALGENNYPDIIYIDDVLLDKYKKILATPTPVFIDTLVAYYNQDVLNFLNLEKPKTIDELKDFILAVKERAKKTDFFPVGIGTSEIRNKKEIILTLLTLNPFYQNKDSFFSNLSSAFNLYSQFGNPQDKFFAYPENFGDDLTNFAEEKIALYLGFFDDKKEIIRKNPRLNFSIDYLPLNTFPPKGRVYTRNYYFAPLKKEREKISQIFIYWFSISKIQNFANDFDLVPVLESKDLPQEKLVVINTAKKFGENFNFINKKILFDNFDRLIKNEGGIDNILQKIYLLL